MIYRSIENLNGTSGAYKRIVVVDDSTGLFERAFITAYADIPDSCRMEEYREDYHDADEIFVWGKYETTTDRMGWGTPEELIRSTNSKNTMMKFKPLVNCKSL